MYIYIYYPGQKKFYLRVFFDRNFNLYWQCSNVFNMLGLSKNVRKGLQIYLGRKENLLRVRDIIDCPKGKIFVTTTEQTSRLLKKARMYGHSNARFETWWRRLVIGSQYLCPRNGKSRSEIVRIYSGSSRGFSAVCVDSRNDTIDPLLSEGEEEEKKGVFSPAAERPSSPGERGCRDEVAEAVAHLATAVPSSSVGTEDSSFPSPTPDLNGQEEEEEEVEDRDATQFTLPGLVRHLKRNVHRPTSNEIPDPPHSSHASPCFTSPEEEIVSTTEYDTIDIDESRSFVVDDPIFKTNYKFVAVKATWNSEIRSVIINPFFSTKSDFLFIPTKRKRPETL